MHMYWKSFVWRNHSNRLLKQVNKKDPTQKKNSFTNRTSRIETTPETGTQRTGCFWRIWQRAEKNTILTFIHRCFVFLNTRAEVMKPAVDEMFPEGAGPYVDLDEVGVYTWFSARNSTIRRVSLSLHTLKKNLKYMWSNRFMCHFI